MSMTKAPGSTLITDLYQLTMAQGYWLTAKAEQPAVFTLGFRENPFNSGYIVAAGIEPVADYLQNFKFNAVDIEYLQSLLAPDKTPLFKNEFLAYLAQLEFGCDIDAVAEGSIMFPHEPILQVKGPLLQAQIIETVLLNQINFSSLIATKASRICRAAGDATVVEFGLRRAQGIDGGASASRAAYIGGAVATSNVYAGMKYNIPVVGTHSHSWVMAFSNEAEAFTNYINCFPNNCTLLVDTYDSISGIKQAISAVKAQNLPSAKFRAVRLDSGNLYNLSISARQLLDEAGFKETKIIASNDLDEYTIGELMAKHAPIDIYGVGTRLVTAYSQPALSGVYKLTGIFDDPNEFTPKIKVSNDRAKISNPGVQQVRRFKKHGMYTGDVIYNNFSPPVATPLNTYQGDTKIVFGDNGETYADLLQPLFKQGKLVRDFGELKAIREHVQQEILCFNDDITAIIPQQQYFTGLEQNLMQLKQELLQQQSWR